MALFPYAYDGRFLPVTAEDWSATSASVWPAQWTTTGTVSASGSNGYLTSTTTAYSEASGYAAGVTDGETLVRFLWNAAGSERYATLAARLNTSTHSGYRLLLSGTSAAVQVGTSNSWTSLGSASVTLNTGTWYWARLRFVGTDLRAKVWAYGTAEPAAWTVVTTDATYSTAQSVGVSNINGNDAVADTVRFADFGLWELGGTDTVYAAGNSGSSLTLNLQNGPAQTVTLTGNCTFTLAGAVSGQVSSLELVLTQDGTGSRTVTWPGSVKWSGAAPVLSTTAGEADRALLTSYNGGTTWYGDMIGRNYA